RRVNDGAYERLGVAAPRLEVGLNGGERLFGLVLAKTLRQTLLLHVRLEAEGEARRGHVAQTLRRHAQARRLLHAPTPCGDAGDDEQRRRQLQFNSAQASHTFTHPKLSTPDARPKARTEEV